MQGSTVNSGDVLLAIVENMPAMLARVVIVVQAASGLDAFAISVCVRLAVLLAPSSNIVHRCATNATCRATHARPICLARNTC